jgi:hypothetical protein
VTPFRAGASALVAGMLSVSASANGLGLIPARTAAWTTPAMICIAVGLRLR